MSGEADHGILSLSGSSAARADMSNTLDDGELVDCISFFPLVVRGAG